MGLRVILYYNCLVQIKFKKVIENIPSICCVNEAYKAKLETAHQPLTEVSEFLLRLHVLMSNDFVP